ncbi:hypothetical protein N7533_012591 [Penicillium manginii]|uniref:uncharacterized protein n=1 Tax=Penicillium manginii TaxID=203109 RepID=UPI002547CF81|nr:uncharacterized protein N7533_012591 [Penicillium manginii]KAJ5739807.1 hypothetical protein N7533_012591 [Penicillium manginii]
MLKFFGLPFDIGLVIGFSPFVLRRFGEELCPNIAVVPVGFRRYRKEARVNIGAIPLNVVVVGCIRVRHIFHFPGRADSFGGK